MNEFDSHAMTIRLTTVLLLSILPALSAAQGSQIQVPFRFSEDEKLVQTDLQKAVPQGRDLQADAYLSAPMTRLEYMLTRLELSLNDEMNIAPLRRSLSEGFMPLDKPRITGFAWYERESARIIAGYTLSGLGVPKKPMRTQCDTILTRLTMEAPQENLGFLLHSMVLGVLQHEDLGTYTPAMETLAKSIVHRVILESKTEDLSTTHVLSCQRTGKSAPVQYERFSFSTKLPH